VSATTREVESLWRGLLDGLALGEPNAGHELADALGGPAAGEPVEQVAKVFVGVGPAQRAVEREGQQGGVARPRLGRADEQAVVAVEGHRPQQPLDMRVGDRQRAIVEEGPQGQVLVLPVADGLGQRGLALAEASEGLDLAFEGCPQRPGLLLAQSQSWVGPVARVGFALDGVQGVVQADDGFDTAVTLLEGIDKAPASVVVAAGARAGCAGAEQGRDAAVAVVLDDACEALENLLGMRALPVRRILAVSDLLDVTDVEPQTAALDAVGRVALLGRQRGVIEANEVAEPKSSSWTKGASNSASCPARANQS
jgi:hypothetical protein